MVAAGTKCPFPCAETFCSGTNGGGARRREGRAMADNPTFTAPADRVSYLLASPGRTASVRPRRPVADQQGAL